MRKDGGKLHLSICRRWRQRSFWGKHWKIKGGGVLLETQIGVFSRVGEKLKLKLKLK